MMIPTVFFFSFFMLDTYVMNYSYFNFRIDLFESIYNTLWIFAIPHILLLWSTKICKINKVYQIDLKILIN